MSGLALTHGNPRHHIWTFAAGKWENPQSTSIDVCPCDTTENIRTPQFVSNDLFCESGYVHGDTTPHGFFSGDLLWDGKDCKHILFSPFFTKSLRQTTTGDLELRIYGFWYFKDIENILVELVELYVKQTSQTLQ